MPAGLTELGESAFERTGLEQIAFPQRLAVIPWAAFLLILDPDLLFESGFTTDGTYVSI